MPGGARRGRRAEADLLARGRLYRHDASSRLLLRVGRPARRHGGPEVGGPRVVVCLRGRVHPVRNVEAAPVRLPERGGDGGRAGGRRGGVDRGVGPEGHRDRDGRAGRARQGDHQQSLEGGLGRGGGHADSDRARVPLPRDRGRHPAGAAVVRRCGGHRPEGPRARVGDGDDLCGRAARHRREEGEHGGAGREPRLEHVERHRHRPRRADRPGGCDAHVGGVVSRGASTSATCTVTTDPTTEASTQAASADTDAAARAPPPTLLSSSACGAGVRPADLGSVWNSSDAGETTRAGPGIAVTCHATAMVRESTRSPPPRQPARAPRRRPGRAGWCWAEA